MNVGEASFFYKRATGLWQSGIDSGLTRVASVKGFAYRTARMPAIFSKPNSSSPWWERSATGWVGLAALAVGSLLLLGAMIQSQFGILGHREWPMPPASKIKADGKGYKVKLPPWGSGSLAEERVVLLKDGCPVGMRVSHAKTVVDHGGGAFKIQKGYLYFSLTKDEDPRAHHRSLSVSLPRPVKPVTWIVGGILLLLGGCMIARNTEARTRLLRTYDSADRLSVTVFVGIVFAVSLSVMLARLPESLSYSDGCFSVKGVPYSDAMGWDALAVNLSEGRDFSGGFSGQRPLYPTMLGFLYMFTGQSLLVAKLLNAFWLAMAATAVCLIGIAGGSRIAGLVGAAGVLMGSDYVSFSKLLLTETSGVAFGAASVLALALAIRTPSWWRIVLAALLLAGSNLANGFGLLALLGYGAIALCTWWAGQGMKKALLQSCLLAGAVALAWMPWLLRQHAVHGIWNLSTSSANLMYAAAAPEHGKLSVEVASAWQEAGVPNEEGARYKFYMAKYAEAVKAYPLAYARTIVRGMETFADYWTLDGPDHFGVVILGVLAVAITYLRKRPAWSVLLAVVVVIGALSALRGKSSEVIWPLAVTLTLLACPREHRPLWALVAVTTPFVAVLAGMTGGNLGRRMWTACEWTMPLLLVMTGSGAIRLITQGLEKAWDRLRPSASAADLKPLSPWAAIWQPQILALSTFISVCLVGHAIIGSGVATGKHLLAQKDNEDAFSISTEAKAEASKLAAAQFEFLKATKPEDASWWIGSGQFGEFICFLDGWEDVQHWARSFQVRSYARSVGFARLQGGGHIACQMRMALRDVPRDQPLLLIGARNHDPKAHLGHDVTMVELLGMVPLQQNQPDWARAIWLPFTREASDIFGPSVKRGD